MATSRILVAILVLGFVLPILAIEDTPENRLEQAKRVVAATPIDETLNDLIDQMFAGKPFEAAIYKRAVEKSEKSGVDKSVLNAYAEVFTPDELDFLATYSSSEIGKRVAKKMTLYLTKVTPVLEAFLKKTFELRKREKKTGAKDAAPQRVVLGSSGSQRVA